MTGDRNPNGSKIFAITDSTPRLDGTDLIAVISYTKWSAAGRYCIPSTGMPSPRSNLRGSPAKSSGARSDSNCGSLLDHFFNISPDLDNVLIKSDFKDSADSYVGAPTQMSSMYVWNFKALLTSGTSLHSVSAI